MFLGNSVLAISSHPDDIEYGCFGTLCKLKESNANIICYVATNGGKNDPTSGLDRIKESRTALNLIPIDHFEGRERIGLCSTDYANVVADLEMVIGAYDIDTVLVPGNNDTHQDHRLICDLTMSAIRRRKISVLFYSTLSSCLDFNANFFVDVTVWFELKKKALKGMSSQNHKSWMEDHYLQLFNSDNYTALLGIKYVEKFEVRQFFV